MPVRVLIADDAEVTRTAIRGLLACEPTIEVCGEAVSSSQTLYLAATLQPDVILRDLHMPDGDSFESAFVKVRLHSIRSRILAMSLPHHSVTLSVSGCWCIPFNVVGTLCSNSTSILRVPGITK
jgi:DNA-binding NarL/FixJ family response regulator